MRQTNGNDILINLKSLVIENSSLVIIFKAFIHKRKVVQATGIDRVVLSEVALDQLQVKSKRSHHSQSFLCHHETFLIILLFIELIDLCLLLSFILLQCSDF